MTGDIIAKILINDVFKKFILKQPAGYRRKLRKQFEFLELGLWEGGLRVKKIKGTPDNKTVFEARLDQSERIIFTIGFDECSAGTDDYRKNVMIYIWGIVSHDDISNKSRSVIPGNAPFLNFTPLSQNDLNEIYLEELDSSDCSQEYITKKVSGDSGQQRWHPLTDTGWHRIELFSKDDFDLQLFLTPEQSGLLNLPPPLLLSGTAGSGKTTIAVYYLLKKSLSRLDKLFITYNRQLKSSAEKLYFSLLNADPSAEDYIAPHFYTYKEFCLNLLAGSSSYYREENEINFERFLPLIKQNPAAGKYDLPLIWEEIRSIIKGALPQLNVSLFSSALNKIKAGQADAGLTNNLLRQFIIFSNLESASRIEHFISKYARMNFPDFIKHFESFTFEDPSRLIPIIENILELFSKQRELTKKKYLSFLEYEMMGKKKAPNFNFDRKDIYRIFEWYQDKLETGHLWDEPDLARESVNFLSSKNPAGFIYDLVVCDEVQDLTDVQHELIFYMVKNPNNLILTGDTRQIINPSGFRWEELKQHFYQRNIRIPEIKFLSLNFRSSGSIVELSNCLLDIKTELLGSSSEQMKEEWKFKARPPVVITDMSEPKIIDQLRVTRVNKTILVRSDEEKDILKSLLETELIFSINEAKGLEFDTVLLWKFCSDKAAADIWENILSGAESGTLHSAKIRHELNLLYVAVTRARQDLLIYDGREPSLIWKDYRLSEKVFLSDDIAFINNIWNVISAPEEWLEQGNYYLERGHYPAAIECYKNAGDEILRLKAEAFNFENKGLFAQAADRFELFGDYFKAARYFESSGNYAKAIELFIRLNNNSLPPNPGNLERNSFEPDIKRCRLLLLEKEKNYSALADIYSNMKDFTRAAEFYLKDKQYEKAGGLYFKLKKYPAAAACFENAGIPEKAVPLYAKSKQYEKAAKLSEKLNDLTKAEIFWKKEKNRNHLLSFYQRTNNIPTLLKYLQKSGDIPAAVKLLKKSYTPFELNGKGAEFFREEKFHLAYLYFTASGEHKGIAASAIALKKYSEAAMHLELNNDTNLAGEAYLKAKDYIKAFTCFITSKEDKEIGYLQSLKAASRMDYFELEAIGQKFFTAGNFELALQVSLINNNYFNAGLCYFHLGNDNKTVELWKKCLSRDYTEQIAIYSLNSGRTDLCARVILESDIKMFYDIYGSPKILTEKSFLVKLMDKYFQSVSSPEEKYKWALRLGLMDNKGLHLKTAIKYFVLSEAWNDLFKYLYRANYSSYPPPAGVKEYITNTENVPDTRPEINAIKFFLNRNRKGLEEIVSQLELSMNNYIICAAGGLEKAYNLFLQNENGVIIKLILVENREFQRLAAWYEQTGYFTDAAHYYWVGGNYEKSTSLYISLKNYLKAGDVYYEVKDFRNALDMYIKHGKNKTKIASTLVKLGRFDEAENIYLRQKKFARAAEVRKLKERSLKHSLFT